MLAVVLFISLFSKRAQHGVLMWINKCNLVPVLCARSEAWRLFYFAWWCHKKTVKQYIFSCFPPFHFTLCLSLFLLLFVNHFSFVFCLICLPSANAFHPRVCGLQPLQPSGVQQPPAGRELRRFQQGNELEGLKINRQGWDQERRGNVLLRKA